MDFKCFSLMLWLFKAYDSLMRFRCGNIMASSEEEGEIGPEFVTNYHFVNNKEEPISFTILPLYGSAREIPDGLKVQVFLRGTVDNGLHKIYKQVFAWKFDLSYVQPEILVLSKNKNWITLQSPRKSFENIIRTSLITVYCLHFVKKNPEASEESIWNHIVKSFRCAFMYQPFVLYLILLALVTIINHLCIMQLLRDQTFCEWFGRSHSTNSWSC